MTIIKQLEMSFIIRRFVKGATRVQLCSNPVPKGYRADWRMHCKHITDEKFRQRLIRDIEQRGFAVESTYVRGLGENDYYFDIKTIDDARYETKMFGG